MNPYWEAENENERAELRLERQSGCMNVTTFVYVVDKRTGRESGPYGLDGRTKDIVDRIAGK